VKAIFFISICSVVFLFLPACKNDPKTDSAALSAATKGNVDPAVFVLTEKIKASPNEDSLYYLRADAYYKSEGYDEAIADLQRAISLDTTQVAYFHLLADCYLDYFKSYPAIQTLEDARRRFPESIATMLKLSEFYLIVKKHGPAMNMVQEVMKRDPQHAEAFFMASLIAKDKGDTTLAIKNMERSVAVAPDNLDAWIILGNLLSNKNDQIALKYYQNALRIDTSSMEAWDGIATYHHKKGDFGLAIDVYKKMINIEPSRPGTFYDLGLIYLEQDSFGLAKSHMQMAIDQDPLFFKAFYFRGVANEKLGDLVGARADYEQASKMVSDFEEAKTALTLLDKRMKKTGNGK
jgi:tetratricopeptide (TPR) repeat protein